MLRFVLMIVLCSSVAMAMTTVGTTKAHHHHQHSPKPSHEPVEHENFKFVYEPFTHKMLVIANKSCYVFSLSDDERAAIHTDAGIRAVELKLLSSLSTAMVSEVTKDQLDAKTAHACGAHLQHYYTESSA